MPPTPTPTPPIPTPTPSATATPSPTEPHDRHSPPSPMSDNLPASVNFVSVTPSQGSCGGTSSVGCFLGALPAFSSATVTLVVTPTVAGPLSNTASAQPAATDPNQLNNSATASTTVLPAPTPTPTPPTPTPTPSATAYSHPIGGPTNRYCGNHRRLARPGPGWPEPDLYHNRNQLWSQRRDECDDDGHLAGRREFCFCDPKSG